MRIGTEVRGLFVQMEKEFPDLGLGPGAEESQQLDPHPLLWDLSCPACTWSLEGYLRFSLLLRRETSGGLVQIVSQAPQLSHAQPIIHFGRNHRTLGSSNWRVTGSEGLLPQAPPLHTQGPETLRAGEHPARRPKGDAEPK